MGEGRSIAPLKSSGLWRTLRYPGGGLEGRGGIRRSHDARSLSRSREHATSPGAGHRQKPREGFEPSKSGLAVRRISHSATSAFSAGGLAKLKPTDLPEPGRGRSPLGPLPRTSGARLRGPMGRSADRAGGSAGFEGPGDRYVTSMESVVLRTGAVAPGEVRENPTT